MRNWRMNVGKKLYYSENNILETNNNNNLYSLHKNMYIKHIKSKHVIIRKSTMTTSVYKNMIYRKLNEDIHVVMLRGTQMVN